MESMEGKRTTTRCLGVRRYTMRRRIWQIRIQVDTCSCFGQVSVSPKYILGFDTFLVIASGGCFSSVQVGQMKKSTGFG